MKRTLSLAVIPYVVAVGACSGGSGSSSSQAQPKDDGGAGANVGEGGASDEASPGDDAAGTGDDGNTATEFDATLSGAEVVPPVATSSSGLAKFFLQEDGVTLGYDVTLSVPNATAVSLHVGAPGENGGVTHALTPLSGHMTGSISLSMGEQGAITAGQLYLDVQTPGNPAGEVRGQLVRPGSEIFVAAPTGAQEMPSVDSTYHAHASFIISPDQANVAYHVVTDAVPTDVRLHRGIGSLNGPVAYPLSPVGQTIDGVLQIATSDPADLEAGRLYLNIVTAKNPAGELRGQLIKPGETLFTGLLSGNNEVPPVTSQATGGTQVILVATQDKLRYEAVVSGIIPTGAELDNALAKENGPALYQLSLDPQGAIGTTGVTAGDVTQLFRAAIYANIRTASFASGELRAQLVQQ